MEDQLCFIPDRKLLNPKFESYKLQEYDQSKVRRIPLPARIDLSTNPDFKSFNFQELKSKTLWNHLLIGTFPDATPAQLIWIEPKTLQIFTLNQPNSDNPQVSALLRLPDQRAEQLGDQRDEGIEFDYPSGKALNHHHTLNYPVSAQKEKTAPNLWLILDGGRSLFLVDLNPHCSSSRILASKELAHPSDCFIHGFYKLASVQVKDRQADTFWVFLRAKSLQKALEAEQDVEAKTAGLSKKKKLLFTLYLIEMRIKPNPHVSTTTDPSSILPFDLDIRLHAQLSGPDELLSVHYDRPGHRWCLRSTSKFTTLSSQQQTSQPQEQPKVQPDQLQKTKDPEPSVTSSGPSPPYSWSQTLSTLTILFPIPFPITSKSIKVDFQSGSLSFGLPKPEFLPKEAEDYLWKLFEYFGQQLLGTQQQQDGGSLVLDLWDLVATEDSTWFVESVGNKRASQSTTTLLTIELEKRSRLRWPQAFKVDAHVPETMDPIELLSITENLAKYTSTANIDDEDQAGDQRCKKKKRGLGSATDPIPSATMGTHPIVQNSSLSAGEMDEEIDVANEVMVTGVVMTWLIQKPSDDRPGPDVGADRTDREWLVKVAQQGIPVEQISSPLKVVRQALRSSSSEPPLSEGEKEDLEGWMMIKSDIDGLVFSPCEGGEDKQDLRWRHRMSFPALAFVMASKREIWASFFTEDICLLLETSSSTGSASNNQERQSLGNLFVYHRAPHLLPTSSQQVIQLPSSPPTTLSSLQLPPRILGLCAFPAPHPNPNHHSLSILLLSQHEILLFPL